MLWMSLSSCESLCACRKAHDGTMLFWGVDAVTVITPRCCVGSSNSPSTSQTITHSPGATVLLNLERALAVFLCLHGLLTHFPHICIAAAPSWKLLPLLLLLMIFVTVSSSSSQSSVATLVISAPKYFWISIKASQSLRLLTNVTATPTRPKRPVRPILCR